MEPQTHSAIERSFNAHPGGLLHSDDVKTGNRKHVGETFSFALVTTRDSRRLTRPGEAQSIAENPRNMSGPDDSPANHFSDSL